MERWRAPGYAQILQARATPEGWLTVLFADATWVEVEGRRLLSAGAAALCWEAVSVDESGGFLQVPAEGDPIELPADRIRVLTDPEFAEHRAILACAEARHIGRRIRTLRRRRGLSARALAERAGISAVSMSRIELGQHDVVLTTLARILAAMDCSFDDLEAESEAKHATQSRVLTTYANDRESRMADAATTADRPGAATPAYPAHQDR